MDQKLINVLDKQFQLSIPHEEIQATVKRIASDLDRDFMGKKPVFLSVLNGSFMFAADLFKELCQPCTISFVKMASYVGKSSSGAVKELIGLNEDLRDQTVIIVEDIIDTGLTIQKLLGDLVAHQPAEIKIVTFLHKPDAFRGNYHIDYLGLSIPDEFIVGYGLDYDGYGRNLKDIYTLLP